jgi:hypothetical protein
MLRRKLNKSQFDALSDELKSVYTPEGDSYVLDVEGGLEDASSLKAALDTERNRVKEVARARDAALAQVTELQGSDATKELTKQIEALSADNAKLQTFSTQVLVNQTAEGIARKLSGNNWEAMLPHVTARLSADFTGDKPVTKVLKDGKASDTSLTDLETELSSNKGLAGIIVGSKASGGGTTLKPTVPSGGSATDAPKLLAKMTPSEAVAHMKARKAEQTADA